MTEMTVSWLKLSTKNCVQKPPKCRSCGVRIAKKPNRLKNWRERDGLCRKCFRREESA